VTSTAESGRERGGGPWLRILLLAAVLLLLSWETPAPWNALWLAVPGAVAVSLLVSWRFGAWGVAVPLILFGASLAIAGPFSLWVWWIPVSALTGTWMGLREEGLGTSPGHRAWMLLPLLLLAAVLPWMLEYAPLVQSVGAEMRRADDHMLEVLAKSSAGERAQSVRQAILETAEVQRRLLPYMLPSLLFLWMAVLSVAGRGLASRTARLMRWPELSRARLVEWRLPDGAIWVMIAGLGLLLSPLPAWKPSGWTLLIGSGLGYCVQGIAVVESLLLARGVPPSMIFLMLVFVFAMATPVFVLAATAVGVSDLWLDYRRIEAVPDGD
jgi:hypothetical protein